VIDAKQRNSSSIWIHIPFNEFHYQNQTFSGTLAVHIVTQGMRGNECDHHRAIANCRLLKKSVVCALASSRVWHLFPRVWHTG
jgi:hypothetical protein